MTELITICTSAEFIIYVADNRNKRSVIMSVYKTILFFS